MTNSNVDYSQKVVEMKNITKKFGNFTANDNISLTVHKGEVHALLGEIISTYFRRDIYKWEKS